MMPAYTSPLGYHRHLCPECGTVWEHRDGGPDKARCGGPAATHDCPKPGCYSFDVFQYRGPRAPDYTTKGHRPGASA
jgi:hypothetical protein